MDRSRLSSLIVRWAVEGGFDRAGVASLEPIASGEAFVRWLDRGDHADMSYLERRLETRLHPQSALEGAQSVVCVALRYHPLVDRSGHGRESNDLWQGVARYARGRDYHELMERRLERLAERIETYFPGIGARVYVDTGPVLERELARRAGLGAVGKNTCLIHRDGGSWFLLGELFLSLDLEPLTTPVTDLCGSCTLCLQACPTGALRSPYRLDANRCISYWTIERRGDIPAGVRPTLGSWVFGCDLCQEVCPWNRRSSAPADHPELELGDSQAELGLLELLKLTPEGLGRRLGGSPLKRAKPEGLQRNAAVAMGNRGDERYREGLCWAAENHSSDLVRSHSEWALDWLRGVARRGRPPADEHGPHPDHPGPSEAPSGGGDRG